MFCSNYNAEKGTGRAKFNGNCKSEFVLLWKFNSNSLNWALYGRSYWKPVETVFLLSNKWDNVQRASHYGEKQTQRFVLVAEFGITLIISRHKVQPTKRSSSQEF